MTGQVHKRLPGLTADEHGGHAQSRRRAAERVKHGGRQGRRGLLPTQVKNRAPRGSAIPGFPARRRPRVHHDKRGVAPLCFGHRGVQCCQVAEAAGNTDHHPVDAYQAHSATPHRLSLHTPTSLTARAAVENDVHAVITTRPRTLNGQRRTVPHPTDLRQDERGSSSERSFLAAQ